MEVFLTLQLLVMTVFLDMILSHRQVIMNFAILKMHNLDKFIYYKSQKKFGYS